MRGAEYTELRAFCAVVEHGSFNRAAVSLGLAPSSLSQIIRQLEERVGIRLLNRTTRSVALSEAGSRLLSRLRPALAELDGALEDMKSLRDSPAGLLRINAPRTAAIHFVAPLLPRFLQRWPDIRVELVADDRLIDIVAERFDAGIRLGERVEKDMVAVKFGGKVQMVAVASPDYVAAHGLPTTPTDLHTHQCIGFRMPTRHELYKWEFERGRKKLEVAVEGALIVNEPEVAIRAAVGGAGVAYVFRHQAEAALRSGELVAMLEAWSPPFPGMYLYYPNRNASPALRTFIDFIARIR